MSEVTQFPPQSDIHVKPDVESLGQSRHSAVVGDVVQISQPAHQPSIGFFQTMFGFKLYETTISDKKVDVLSVLESKVLGKASEGSIKSKKSRNKAKSSKCIYAIAPSAPMTLSQRLLRTGPRLLYQIQRIPTCSRPVPTLDILHPLSNMIPRVARGFPCLFNGRDEMGPSDVLICHSENYETKITSTYKRKDYFNRRIPVAAIHESDVLDDDESEICFRDGSVWQARALGKNTFEFRNKTQEGGKEVVARWVLRRSSKKASVSSQASTDFGSNMIFSLIEPDRRQHPVLATLTKNVLEISDFYRAVTDVHTAGEDSDSQISHRSSERPYLAVADDTKLLAQITSVWVTLRMGWCSNFSYPEEATKSCLCTRTCSSKSNTLSRSTTPELSDTRPSSGRLRRVETMRTAQSSIDLDIKEVQTKLEGENVSAVNGSSWRVWKRQKSKSIHD